MIEQLLEIIKQSIVITSFILVMMMILEFVTIQTRGRWDSKLKEKPFYQIILGALLGLTPGCLGTYTLVALYMHKIVGFSALIAGLIATCGDEFFLLFATIPDKALIIVSVLGATGLVVGILFKVFFKNMYIDKNRLSHINYHKGQDDCNCFKFDKIIPQLKNISFHRLLLIIIGVFFLYMLFLGEDGHFEFLHFHEIDPHHNHHGHKHDHGFTWSWLNTTLVLVNFIGLFIVLTVSDHFLDKHLWQHIIRKHMFKIFLWIFGTISVIYLLSLEYNIHDVVQGNSFIILILALLIGIIPISGPHIIFIVLFINGTIPFTILLANSIVQDGHGALPLFAESKKSFFVAKAIKIVLGFVIGLSGIMLNI